MDQAQLEKMEMPIIGYSCPDWIKSEYSEVSSKYVPTTASEKAIVAKKSKAFERVSTLGIPTTKNENWKYTSLSEFSKLGFARANSFALKESDLQEATKKIEELSFIAQDSLKIVFVNGALVSQDALPEGVNCRIFNPATSGGEEGFEPAFSVADFEKRPLVALNTALCLEVVCFDVAKNSNNDSPIILIFVTTTKEATYTCPRVFINAGANSKALFIECYLGQGDAQYLTNAVTEIKAEEGANIDHYRIQLEGKNAYHVSSVDLLQASNSNVSTRTYSVGGKLVRNEVNPVLNGEGIDTIMHGLSVLNEDQHVDNHTVIDHAKPHSQSTELYKGIYTGKSKGVFNGTIIVRPQAQKTNAIQSNQTLLLSEDASVETQPQLKIWADDVKCTHGATIGQISEDGLFYLRSRGIDQKTARDILVYGFTSDLLDAVKIDSLREFLENSLLNKLKISKE